MIKETSLRVWKVGGSIPGWVKSKTKFKPVASLVNVHHLRSRAGLVWPVQVSVECDWVGFIFSMVLQCTGTLKPGLNLPWTSTAELTHL